VYFNAYETDEDVLKTKSLEVPHVNDGSTRNNLKTADSKRNHELPSNRRNNWTPIGKTTDNKKFGIAYKKVTFNGLSSWRHMLMKTTS